MRRRRLRRIRSPMKIAIVIHSMEGGGAERVTATLANAWVGRGHDVTIITFAPRTLDLYPLDSSIGRASLDMARGSPTVLSAIARNLGRMLKLRREIGRAQPDVILAMMAISGVATGLATCGMGIPVVAAERSYPPRMPLGRAWELLRRWPYPRLAAVVSQTSECANWVVENCPGSGSRVIANPVPWPLTHGQPLLLPASVVREGRLLLLAAGRLGSEKGFDRLITAFARLERSFPGWELAIIGEGPERSALLAHANRLGLSGRIFLPGRVGNVQDWYERAALFVLSSEFEGFPNVLVEAMACGCPVVSFDCDAGPRDIVRPGVDGLLVPPKDGAPALADALASLMSDEPLRRAMGERARAVRERFSMDSILRQWDELFCGLRMRRRIHVPRT